MSTFTQKILLSFCLAAAAVGHSRAQVGIGTTTPAASAMLDVTATNKGFLPPRVELTGTTDVATIPSPATGLLVWNLATGGLTPAGYYYWNGTAWTALSGGGGGSSLYTADGTLTGNRIVSTTSGYTLTLSPKTIFNPSLTATGAGEAVGVSITPALTSDGDFSSLIGVNIEPTFVTGTDVNLVTYGLRVQGHGIGLGGGSWPENLAVGSDALLRNIGGTYNTAVGRKTLEENTTGYRNTAVGSNAMADNTEGYDNTALGYQAMERTETAVGTTAAGYRAARETNGIYNTAIGYRALTNNDNGAGNVVVGKNALSRSVIGDNNTAIGTDALLNYIPTASSNSNIAIGNMALMGQATGMAGHTNIAIGNEAMLVNETGTDNTVIGYNTLKATTTGNNNVGVGNNSLMVLTTGSNNTAIGFNAGPAVGSETVTNSTAIGYNASVSASNFIQLGNADVTTIRGQVNFTAASDRRLKESITNSKYGLKEVMALRPVDYIMTSNRLKQVGFIAQEVQTLVPEVVTGKEGEISKGETLGITYSNLVPVLTKAIQEQQAMIEQLKAEIEALKKAR